MFVELLTVTITQESLNGDAKVTKSVTSSNRQEINSEFFNPIVETLANLNNK